MDHSITFNVLYVRYSTLYGTFDVHFVINTEILLSSWLND